MRYKPMLAALLAMSALLAMPARAAETQGAPEISAHAAVLVEADTGRTLWGKNADEPMLIASTTKLMTALVTLDRCDPDTVVTVAPEWTGIEGSSMYLRPGQELTVRELLYGLMLASGNDAATALACVAAGSAEAFAALMNEKAAALGCVNTSFENPSGFDSPRHHASARDLAVIAREAIRNDTLREIMSCRAHEIGGLTFVNHNRLLRDCEGVFAGKTGYTVAAGRTLVTACERNGVTLICVTLSDPDDWRDHAAMYDWAYDNFTLYELVISPEALVIPVVGGAQETVTVSPERPLCVLHSGTETVDVTVSLPKFVYAGVTAGQEAGQMRSSIDGFDTGSVRLVYDTGVERETEEAANVWERLRAFFGAGERKVYTLS